MGIEIERKFLVNGSRWRSLARGVRYRQGYLSSVRERVVRVRTAGGVGFLTVKGITTGAARLEFEYDIPETDANQMLDALCEKPLIEKKRYTIPVDEFVWEVDEFFGDNDGLVVAEIELRSEDQAFRKPDWVGAEVTGDPRYFNVNLIRNPYCRWGKK